MYRTAIAVVAVVVLAGCGSAVAPSASSTPTASPLPTTASPTAASSLPPTAESTIAPTAIAVELQLEQAILTRTDVPSGFNQVVEVPITLESEGSDLGAGRLAALEARGFLKGLRRGFTLAGGQLVSTALLFDNSDGAKAEFKESADQACKQKLAIDAPLGDESASWVCPSQGLGKDSAVVMFRDDAFVVTVQWRAEGALLPASHLILVELTRLLASRLTG